VDGVSPVHHNEVGIQLISRVERRPQLAHHLLFGDDLLPLHMPAPLRRHLILHEEAGRPRPEVLLHRPVRVDRVAEPVVGVAQNGNPHGSGDRANLGGHLRHVEQPDVRLSEMDCRRAVSRVKDRLEADHLADARAQRVVHPRNDKRSGTRDQCAKMRCHLLHAFSSSVRPSRPVAYFFSISRIPSSPISALNSAKGIMSLIQSAVVPARFSVSSTAPTAFAAA